ATGAAVGGARLWALGDPPLAGVHQAEGPDRGRRARAADAVDWRVSLPFTKTKRRGRRHKTSRARAGQAAGLGAAHPPAGSAASGTLPAAGGRTPATGPAAAPPRHAPSAGPRPATRLPLAPRRPPCRDRGGCTSTRPAERTEGTRKPVARAARPGRTPRSPRSEHGAGCSDRDLTSAPPPWPAGPSDPPAPPIE